MIFTMISATTACLEKPRKRGIGLLAPLAFAQIFVLSLLSATLSAAAEPANEAANANLPNILWLTCEDMSPNLGCYGDKFATTPALDALAGRGMRYANVSSNAPVCAPARTTIITGLYPPSIGAEHMRSETVLPAGFRMFPQYLRGAGYYCTNNAKEDYNVAKPGRVWDDSSHRAHWSNRNPGQPFFAVFNNTITHESQIRNHIEAANKIHDPAGVRVPVYHPDTPEVRRDWAQYYDRITMMDTGVAARLKELDNAGLTDDTIVFYFSDHGSGMPRHKRWLYGSGLNVPFIVYFPPKWRHLAPRGYQEGGTSDRLISFIDLAPTMLSLANLKPPEWMQGNAFAGEDQAKEPEYSYGFRARMDERYDLSRNVRDKRYRYIRNYMPHLPYGQHLSYMFETPTTRVWFDLNQQGKLNAAQAAFWQQKPSEELYDTTTDPEELHNLVDSPEHAEVLHRLRTAHRDWEREIKDVSFLSESEMHQRANGTSPYEMGHDATRYDFDAIFSAAELASTANTNSIPDLVKLLEDPDSGVRYWAAVGLLAHEETGVKAGHDELVAALRDESPIVRITAAEAIARFDTDADATAALKVLLKYAQSDSDYLLNVAAWNSLDYLDDRASAALPLLKEISTNRTNAPKRMGEYPTRLKQKTLSDLESTTP
jgi:arylsulfatase A-like enzyme